MVAKLLGANYRGARTVSTIGPQAAVSEAGQRREVLHGIQRAAEDITQARREFVATQALAAYNEENSAFRRTMDQFDTISAAQAEQIATEYGVEINIGDKQALRKDEWYPQVLEKQLSKSREKHLKGIRSNDDRRELENRLRANELQVLEREGEVAAEQARRADQNEERAAVNAAMGRGDYDGARALVNASSLYRTTPEAKAEVIGKIESAQEDDDKRVAAEAFGAQLDEVIYSGTDAELKGVIKDMRANRKDVPLEQPAYRAAIARAQSELNYRQRGTAQNENQLARNTMKNIQAVVEAAPLSVTKEMLSEGRAATRGTDYEEAYKSFVSTFEYTFVSAKERQERIDSMAGDLSKGTELAALTNQQNQIRQSARKDGIATAASLGLIGEGGRPLPVDFTNRADVERAYADGEKASLHFSTDVDPVYVSPFSAQQAKELVSLLENAPVQQAGLVLNNLSDAPVGLWGQLAGDKDGRKYAMAGASGDTALTMAVLDGHRRLAEDASLKPTYADYIEDFNEYMGAPGTTYPVQDHADMLSATLAVYYSMGGNKEFDSKLFESAMQATSGGVSTINGAGVEVPRGTEDADQFEDYIEHFRPDLLPPGAEDGTGKSRDEIAEVIRDSVPKKLRNGNYIFTFSTLDGQAAIFDQNGRPWELDIDPAAVNGFKRNRRRRR